MQKKLYLTPLVAKAYPQMLPNPIYRLGQLITSISGSPSQSVGL